MNINFVTQWFPPESAGNVAAKIARGLAARGHRVQVLTGFPNYPTGRVDPAYPLRSYRRDCTDEGIDVHRAWLYPSHDRSSLRRAANYLSFAVSAARVARVKLQKPDAWLVYSSPATAALPALLAKRAQQAPIFLIIQDLWPDTVVESQLLPSAFMRTLEGLLGSFCMRAYRRSAGIGVISPGMADVLKRRGVPASKVYYTPNWYDDRFVLRHERPSEELRRSLGLPQSGRLFLYAGNLGEFQELAPLLQAFQHCPQAQLMLMGDGVAKPSLEAQAKQLGLSNVRFLDPQPIHRMGSYLAAADVHIVSLADLPLLRSTTPSKLQAALASGRAVLAHAAGDVADAVVRSGGGLAARPGEEPETVHAIQRLAGCSSADLERMGRAARRYYEKHFSEDAGLDHLEAMLERRQEAQTAQGDASAAPFIGASRGRQSTW